MSPRFARLVLLPLLLAGALLGMGEAQARWSGDGWERSTRVQVRDGRSWRRQAEQRSEERVTREQAASNARDATGGRVLRVDPNNDGYRVKVLTDDRRVRNVDVDDRGRVRR
ncbi:MAG: PepSY domain-containing protein [Gammaproteobacteria bacterium]